MSIISTPYIENLKEICRILYLFIFLPHERFEAAAPQAAVQPGLPRERQLVVRVETLPVC